MENEVADSSLGDLEEGKEQPPSPSYQDASEKELPEGSDQEEKKNPSLGRAIGITFACMLGMVANISTLTSTSIALPTIGREFNVGPNESQWLISAYSLSSGCLLILFGRFADLWGRKLAFLTGVGWTLAFSIGCGFAPNNNSLIFLRALQGCGPAAIVPAALGILAHSFPPGKMRSTAFATFSAGAPLGGAVGYLLGGVMTQLTKQTWRSVYFLTAGILGLIFIMALIFFDWDKPLAQDRRVDLLGAFLVTAGLAMLLFVLGDGTVAPKGWKTPYVIVLLVISILLLCSFVMWEHYLQSRTSYPPLMNLNIWTRGSGRFAIMQLIAFSEWCGFQSWTLWATLYYQDYIMLSPIKTMIRFLPMMVTGICCNVVVGMTVNKLPAHWLVVAGCLITSIAPLLFAVINTSSSYWAFGFPAAICSVFGADFVFATGTLYVAKLALPAEQSLAGALFQTLIQIGSAFGLTVTTTVHNAVVTQRAKAMGVIVNSEESNAPPAAMLAGFRAAHWSAFAFPILAALLGIVYLRGVGIVGHKSKKSGQR